jgi:hypothetical protein
MAVPKQVIDEMQSIWDAAKRGSKMPREWNLWWQCVLRKDWQAKILQSPGEASELESNLIHRACVAREELMGHLQKKVENHDAEAVMKEEVRLRGIQDKLARKSFQKLEEAVTEQKKDMKKTIQQAWDEAGQRRLLLTGGKRQGELMTRANTEAIL